MGKDLNYFWCRISCNLDWPETRSDAEDDWEILILLSPFWVLELQEGAIMPPIVRREPKISCMVGRYSTN